MTVKKLFVSTFVLSLIGFGWWINPITGKYSQINLLTRSLASEGNLKSPFVQVVDGHFSIKGDRYTYLGTNLWAAMNLGSTGVGGDRARLTRELDRLQKLGIKNLRIVAGSEGPETEPGRIAPALQKTPGEFDQDLLNGLDFTLAEMSKRDMKAVMVLNNFWAWSGGMAQYVSWATKSSIPYPPPFGKNTWDEFQDYSSKFYSNSRALDMANHAMKEIITRKNAITGMLYSEDPAIMSWELANEPRGVKNTGDFNRWLASASSLIKSMDANHLVTTGSEGSLPNSGVEIPENHKYKTIDYVTTHIWAQNFGWYDPTQPSTITSAIQKMKDFLDLAIKDSNTVKKPLVLEEFGFSRDGNSYDPTSTTKLRDQYYTEILNQALSKAKAHQAVSGVNFWAWAGEATPPRNRPDHLWKAGDVLLGDPPHEPQGWYSIYSTDASTLKVLNSFSALFSAVR